MILISLAGANVDGFVRSTGLDRGIRVLYKRSNTLIKGTVFKECIKLNLKARRLTEVLVKCL